VAAPADPVGVPAGDRADAPRGPAAADADRADPEGDAADDPEACAAGDPCRAGSRSLNSTAA